jgi:hypothetical protein
MKFRAAIALLAFAVPAFAQHGGARAGSFGGRGFSGPAGFSSHPAFARPGFSQSPGFSRTGPPVRYGTLGNAGFRAIRPPSYSGFRSPYNANRFAAPMSSRRAGPSRGWNRDRDRNFDHGRFDRRRRDFQNWYVSSYPYWPGYPYLYDPNAYNLGLYDWSVPDDSASDSSQLSNSGPESYAPDQGDGEAGPALLYPPAYPSPRPAYSGEENSMPQRQSAASPEQPLTVIFNNGRSPIKVRNYMMTAKVLTDLDDEHYEQIPLAEIDLAATHRTNIAAGVDFQVPGA